MGGKGRTREGRGMEGGRGEGRRGEEKGRGREYSLAEATTAPPPHMSCSIGVTKAVVELRMRLCTCGLQEHTFLSSILGTSS